MYFCATNVFYTNQKRYIMTVREAIEDIFNLRSMDYSNKEMDLDFITLEICEHITDFKDKNRDELRPKVAAAINGMLTKMVKGKKVQDSESIIVRVSNGRGGYKKGIYKLRKPKKQKDRLPITPVEPSKVSVENSLYVGSAGEMAVCSELLFRGYNVSRMMVDEGVDVVAIRHERTYYIQVKTVTLKSTGFAIKIKEKSFSKYCNNNCYYIVVIRTATKKGIPINQYLVMTADDIKIWMSSEIVKLSGNDISLSFNQKDGHIYLKDELVDSKLNNFGRIS